MTIDFEGIKRLAPEKRVKALKEVMEELQEEITERQKEIEQAEQLLSISEEEEKVLEEIEIPKEEKKLARKIQEEKLKREPANRLEEILETAPKQELIHEVARLPVSELYKELKDIYQREKQTGVETQEDREKLYFIRQGLRVKKEEGYVPKERQLMSRAEQIAEDMYKSGAGSYSRN